MQIKVKHCNYCGVVLEHGSRTYCSPACRKLAQKNRNEVKNGLKGLVDKSNLEENEITLDKLCLAARYLGMSYGNLVAKRDIWKTITDAEIREAAQKQLKINRDQVLKHTIIRRSSFCNVYTGGKR